MRTIIVGDIHGCRGAFLRLLENIGFDRNENPLILLGDLFDWGPDPCGTYIAVRSLKEEMKDRMVLIRGDHDQMMLDAVIPTRGQIANSLIWRGNGGRETLGSFRRRKMQPGSAAAWLRDNTRVWYEDDLFLCAHGNIRDEVIWNNSNLDLIWGNEGVHSNTYRGKLALVGHTQVPTPTYLDGSGGEPSFHPKYGTWFELPKRGMIALDTGAGNGGALSCLITENGWMRFECEPEGKD